MNVSVEEYYKFTDEHILIDVRSPGEYSQGHIPNAINIPLFTDEERAKVGTTYKKRGNYAAILEGLEFVGPKMKQLVTTAKSNAEEKKVFVYCWRGGQRSESIRWLLSTAGLDAHKVTGGYKAMRNYMHDQFAISGQPLIILSGATGSGKTEILHALREQGEQVIDLEFFAHHKGSSFGALGQLKQPSSEQFNNDIFQTYQTFDISKRIWVENESRTVGRVFIGEELWSQMEQAKIIEVKVPIQKRIEFLVEHYGNFPVEDLIASFERISKRLGGQNVKEAVGLLRKGDIEKAAYIALDYYDKAYLFSRKKRSQESDYTLDLSGMEFEQNAAKLIDLAEKYKL